MQKLTDNDLRDAFESPRTDGPGRKGFDLSPSRLFPRCYRARMNENGQEVPVKSRHGLMYSNPPGCSGIRVQGSRRERRKLEKQRTA